MQSENVPSGITTEARLAPLTRGSHVLQSRSEILKQFKARTWLKRVLIVDDVAQDRRALIGALHLLCGYDLLIDESSSIAQLSEVAKAYSPDLVFLDDQLGPHVHAELSIPKLRHAGITGPIIVISGLVTRTRTMQLLALGVAGILAKDDLSAAGIAAVVVSMVKDD